MLRIIFDGVLLRFWQPISTGCCRCFLSKCCLKGRPARISKTNHGLSSVAITAGGRYSICRLSAKWRVKCSEIATRGSAIVLCTPSVCLPNHKLEGSSCLFNKRSSEHFSFVSRLLMESLNLNTLAHSLPNANNLAISEKDLLNNFKGENRPMISYLLIQDPHN
jgi:hypothetical protein